MDNREILIQAKYRAAELLKSLKSLQKHSKLKTSKEANMLYEALEQFVNCNLSSKSIYRKYERVKNLISQ